MKRLALLLECALCCAAATLPPGIDIHADTDSGAGKFLAAAFESKHVPVRIVAATTEADFTLEGHIVNNSDFVETEQSMAVFKETYETVLLTSRSGVVVWKCVVPNRILKRGDRVNAEYIAEQLKKAFGKP